eukprot:7755111-Pyramimonas_sp.AAC.1
MLWTLARLAMTTVELGKHMETIRGYFGERMRPRTGARMKLVRELARANGPRFTIVENTGAWPRTAPPKGPSMEKGAEKDNLRVRGLPRSS